MPADLLYVQALHVLHVALDKLGLVGATRVDPQVQSVFHDLRSLSLCSEVYLLLQLQAAALAQSVGEEIAQMIAEQKKLEDQFVALVADQPQLRNLPNKNKLLKNQKEVHAVAEQLRLGTQALVRNLKVGRMLLQTASQPAMQSNQQCSQITAL